MNKQDIMDIKTKRRIEKKQEVLEQQFKELTDKLKELEQVTAKVRTDATAINGAIQVCKQLLSEEDEDDKNKS